MTYTVKVLGCGNSEGTPAIGNSWGACDPNEPKNRRTRPCVAVYTDTTTLIIDTGPDFKQQINTHSIKQIDAVLYTHAHADHVSGIDELRSWVKQTKKPMDIYAQKSTLKELENRYDYQFEQKSPEYPAVLRPNVIESDDLYSDMCIGDLDFTVFEQDHGTCKSLGFRFGNIAYSTDLINLPPQSIECLNGIKTWIVDAAGYKGTTNPVHLNLERIYELNETVRAEQIYLTHLTRGMDYQTVKEETPEGYEPAYDGLIIKS